MNFTLTLTAEQISVIGKALGSGVYAEVAGIIQSIQSQVDEQILAQQQPPADTPKSKK